MPMRPKKPSPALVHTFFDWNEVRVTSISELSEVMACLPDPRAAANRIKRVLHAVFEATFNFDLEDRRKKNLGPTVKWLEKLDGTTRFTVAYVLQAALRGHAIPVDSGTMAAFHVLDLVSGKDVAAGVVPGLERAVAKSKGVEFGSLLHELGATTRQTRTRRMCGRSCGRSTRTARAGCRGGGSRPSRRRSRTKRPRTASRPAPQRRRSKANPDRPPAGRSLPRGKRRLARTTCLVQGNLKGPRKNRRRRRNRPRRRFRPRRRSREPVLPRNSPPRKDCRNASRDETNNREPGTRY